ncbi:MULTISPECIES: hypothetical protein [Leptospira]|uniref:hypothetical protein n=1 Tax=Leptospira TaxID=171 RepID=UPI0002BEF268|nr:hypothetical protein LEP1GSC066_1714 [Leptospira sp. serovar Kenya str. Sh9]
MGFLNQEGNVPETQIGFHFGEVITDNVGSKSRKEYTIIGDVIHLAFGVKRLNKEFGTELLATWRFTKKSRTTF